MKVTFIADPLDRFDRISETTFFLAHEFCKRGAICHFAEISDLFLENDSVFARARQVKIQRHSKTGLFSYQILSSSRIHLAREDVVWLRKDPPVDQTFLDHLSVLELLRGKTRLINDPTGIKHAPEKIFGLAYAGLSPQTLVTANTEELFRFVSQHKRCVLKPLNLSGGRGIVIAESGRKDLRSLIEILTKGAREFVCAQKFVTAAKHGDKRVLLWRGSVLGTFLRVPSADDFRGNLHSGARFQKTSLTPAQSHAVKTLAPDLNAWGLDFVGLDFLGDALTEVNVTSPMGIAELNTLYDSHFEKTVVSSLLKTKS